MEFIFDTVFVTNYNRIIKRQKTVKSHFEKSLKDLSNKTISAPSMTSLKLELHQITIYKDVVVLFRLKDNYIIFLNIGTIEEVYK